MKWVENKNDREWEEWYNNSSKEEIKHYINERWKKYQINEYIWIVFVIFIFLIGFMIGVYVTKNTLERLNTFQNADLICEIHGSYLTGYYVNNIGVNQRMTVNCGNETYSYLYGRER